MPNQLTAATTIRLSEKAATNCFEGGTFTLESGLDLSRFAATPLIAFTSTKETYYGTETVGRMPPDAVRIALTSRLHPCEVASWVATLPEREMCAEHASLPLHTKESVEVSSDATHQPPDNPDNRQGHQRGQHFLAQVQRT